MSIEQEIYERDLTRDAFRKLEELNDNLGLAKAFQGLVIAMAQGAEKGFEEDEPIEGALCVFIGDKNSHHLEFTGSFNPYVAYGAAIDAILEVRLLQQDAKAERIVRSFVGNLESAAAQVEKNTTNPDVQ